ncbi:Oidioi.mRNA.OKI2018_I69.chr1.g2355.t1.cds [Oikopleura dioica]|uniref:Oidioi.mRNA.OKI2018_I69.chr1.g2355.t1.cds n=1 Tax=Oikopleura dioica TaxID=34765 RepID=A0ABN7SSJ7_OIKDI|nr:Oidioi.mRNA.OKI2018_I69.chr1.g2355.t1.cds [Oikopleura dioica]
MMHQPAFDYLRTKKALGYIAGSREWSRSGVKAIAIECNTNVNRVSVEEVEALMTKCAVLMLKQFEALSDEQYKTSKAAYVKLLAKPADSMDHYFGTNQIEIYDGTQRFSRKEEESAELMKVTKQEFVDFFKEYIINNKRRMFVAVEGCSQHTRPDGLFKHLPLENADYTQISDFASMSSSFY